ncbi:arsenite methyltransferase [bacterium]|nr:arsenite methyltransferase [bacterium]MCI0604562.1 arsenite methyltransferase [bacterium]
MERTEERIKEQVRERYTAAVTGGDSCCGTKTSCCGVEAQLPEGRAVSAAGYTQEQLISLPADAIANSFGCGNPVAFAGVLPGETVVDIGSGAGIDCLLAGQKVGRNGRVIGIDMTPVMIEKARTNAQKAGLSNVEFRLGDAENIPVESGVADWIVSNCVINLSPNKLRVFQEAYRVLKPGGKVSISDIVVEHMPWPLSRSSALHCACIAGAISESKYLEAMRQAGFGDARVTERITYDRDELYALIEGAKLFGQPLLNGFYRYVVDHYVAGKIWSARIVATKGAIA